MAAPSSRIGWYPATVYDVATSTTVDLSLDLGFGVKMQTRLRLDGVTAPDDRADDSAERSAGEAVHRFVEDWVDAQEGRRVIVHVARMEARGCTGSVWQAAEPHECLNEALIADGMVLDPAGEY